MLLYFVVVGMVCFGCVSDCRPLCYGHRGYSSDYPENTMLSLTQALDNGADGVETDLRVTSDKILILMHDETTTNGTGHVFLQSYYNYVKYLRTRDREQCVPLLSEVLEMLASDRKYADKKLILDIKEDNPIEILDLLKLELQKFDTISADTITLGFWNNEFLERARFLFPKHKIALIHEFWPPKSTHVLPVPRNHWKSFLDYYSVDWKEIPEKWVVDMIHSFGLGILSWVNNDIDSIRMAKERGLDGIHTDNVALCQHLQD